jgi:YD repeat-containing protein
LGCGFSVNVQAQTDSCPAYFQLTSNLQASSCLFIWSPLQLPDPNLPTTAVCCNPGGIPFGQSCAAPKPSCGAPRGADKEVCLSCIKAQAGAPINLSTGNTYIAQSDLSVPGLGGGLGLSRIWNSLLPAIQRSAPFMFGTGWRSNYEERLIFASGDGYMKYVRGDGAVWSFAAVSVGSPNVFKAATPATDTTTTITAGSVSWTLLSKSGEKRLFSATSGLLTSIVDRNGNSTQLTYDASNRLASVADPASRHLFFNYPNGASPLVSSVTTDFGLTVTYAYDGQGNLALVTRPDGTTLSFTYDPQNNITAVRDSDGKVLESHTYDAMGRSLTSSRAGGVDSVTVAYPQ